MPGMANQITNYWRWLWWMSLRLILTARPFERKVLYISRLFHFLNGLQRAPKHLPLTIFITGSAHCLSKGMLDPHQARHAHCYRQIGYVRQGDGGETSLLDLPLNQSHGPAADWSSGYQYDDVNLVLPEMLDDRRCADLK
jgi:hypothetical protein